MSDAKDKWTPMAICGGLLMAAMATWIGSLQATVSDVIAIKPQLKAVTELAVENKNWTLDWQKNGQLPGDVRQDAQIAYLESAYKDLSMDRQKNTERLTRVEERQTAIQSDLKKILMKLDEALGSSDRKHLDR